MTTNKQSYWKKILFLDNFFKSAVLNNRKYFYKIFLNHNNFNEKTTILDVGTTNSLEDP